MNKADLYGKANSMTKRDALLCLEEYTPKIKWQNSFNRLIDIGCGDGSVTNILKKYIPTDFQLLGADISEDMVSHANNIYYNKQTSFTVLNIDGDLPEAMKGNFTHVFSFYALHWIMNQEHAFQNIYDLLDEEGECFMTFLAYTPVFDAYRTLARNNKWSAYMKDVELYVSPYRDSKDPEQEVRDIAEKVGFVDINVECKELSYEYKDIDVYKQLIISINPFKIPNEKYDDFMEDYFKFLKEVNVVDTADTNYTKGATVTYRLLVFHARKPSKHNYYHQSEIFEL